MKDIFAEQGRWNKRLSIATLIILALSGSVSAQQPGNSLSELYPIAGGHSMLVDSVLQHPEKYRLQVILTKIQRHNFKPVGFDTYQFTSGRYFYPASLVKLPVALLTLEVLDSLHIPLSATLKMNKDVNCGSTAFVDKSINTNLSFAGIIEDLMALSDNDNYNLLYHFLSPQQIKRKLIEKQFPHTNIFRSFSGCGINDNLKCNSFSVYNGGRPVYSRAGTRMDSTEMMKYYTYSDDKLVGNQLLQNEVLINGPKDFNYHLEYPLPEIHETIMRLIFPGSFTKSERWKTGNQYRKFFLKCMGIFPSEMKNSQYHDRTRFPTNYNKYLIFGDTNLAENSQQVRTIGKIGISYGFVTESAYIVDFRNRCDFFLSMSMYVNSDGIVNDGKYEYDEIARPFFAQLSRILLQQIILEHEVKKNKKARRYFRKFQQIFD